MRCGLLHRRNRVCYDYAYRVWQYFLFLEILCKILELTARIALLTLVDMIFKCNKESLHSSLNVLPCSGFGKTVFMNETPYPRHYTEG